MILRRLRYLKVIAPVLLAACFINPSAQAQQTTYTGEAVVTTVDVLGVINAKIEDTGPLPQNGGSLSTQLANFAAPGLLSLQLLAASTDGSDNRTNSQASVVNLTLSAAGVYIQASVLASNATAFCDASSATANGTSTIAALTVNGRSIKVTGAPNQTIPLLLGSLIINEQTTTIANSPGGSSADIVVNALHLKIADIANVVISSSHAGVNCSASILQ